MKTYSPFAPDSASRVACVPSLIKVTVAAGTAPPLGSITVPRKRPPVLCALPGVTANAKTSKKITAGKMSRKHDERRCRNCALSFMNSPLCREDSLESPFFVVAAPLKPYYNPVNLEKAGPSVKQKEFIRRIGRAQIFAHAAHQRSGPPRGDFFFGAARLGGHGPGHAAPHAEPLPLVYGIGRAPAAARHFPAPRPRPESRCHRPRSQAPGSRLFSREKLTASRSAFPQIADPPPPFAGAGRSRHRCLDRFSQRAGARPDALLDCHASPHRPLLPHQHSLALRNRRRSSPAGAPPSTENPGNYSGRAHGVARLGKHGDGAAPLPYQAGWRQRRILRA